MVNDLKFWIYTKLINFHLRKVGEYNERKKELAKEMRNIIIEKKQRRLGSAIGEFLGNPIAFWIAVIFYGAITSVIYNSSNGVFLGIDLGAWFVGLFSFGMVGIAYLIKYKS